MTLKRGDYITRSLIEYDENRIYSLGLFNRVQINIVPGADSTAVLSVAVSERWYVFPFPIVGIKDRDWSKWYYGFGVIHTNFRGRGEKIFATAVFGYDPSFRLTYRNPFLNEAGTDFLELSLGYNRVRNRSLYVQSSKTDFDEIHWNGALTLGKRFALNHTLWVMGGYESVATPDAIPPTTFSPSGTDQYPIFSLGYGYDSRDLKEYPNFGSSVRVTATKYGVFGAAYDMVRYAVDLRKFVPLATRLVLGGRTFTDLAAGGPSPTYNHVFYGYGERIRGHFQEVNEGENIMGASVELRYLLFNPIYPKVDFLPAEFSVWRFAIALTAFGDAGTVWFRGTPLALDRFLKGYGGGINFLLPYSIVVRAEYGFNEVRRGEFIIDVGASF
jgi:outer membrane protein assembly factor BamA